jgi:hypothetical protein
VLHDLTKSSEIQVLVTCNTTNSCQPTSILVVPCKTNEVRQIVLDTEERLISYRFPAEKYLLRNLVLLEGTESS